MTTNIQPLLLTIPGRVPEQVPDLGPLIIMGFILMGVVTLGPILVMVVTGAITGGLTTGVSPGKASRVGIGVGLLTTISCWVPIAVLTFLSELENWRLWRDLVLFVIIPLTVLMGIVVTVVLVRRTRN